MPARITFYQLGRKFLERQEDVPQDARQVVYYSLAIGHHLGVIDCLHPLLQLSDADYSAWISCLAPGPARDKLAGLLQWGEIHIDNSHVGLLARAFDTALPNFDAIQAQWTQRLMQALHDMAREPAVYLIAKLRKEELSHA